jgi:hypothetical protein
MSLCEKGDGQKNPVSYPCRKMKISKGGTEKELKKTQKHHVPMQK